ncbi:MAG: EamA family transporter, partial [Clostridia bacterium]|nr:EamA family transporter [Clostridia bacterium]
MSALLIFLSTASNLAESIFIKHYNARHNRGGFIFTAFISFFSMLFFLVTDRNGFCLPPDLWWYAIIAGVLYCSASFLTYVALKIGSYAMTMLILSYSIVMSIGYGLFFLNERATVFTVIGLALVLVSLYLVRAKKTEEKKDKVSLWWLICVIVSA